MKKKHLPLVILPLIALLLSGCYEIIPEDAPEEIEDEFTPEGSYTLPEEDSDYTESSSIPYESTSGTESTGDNTSSPSESTGEDSSSDSTKPSEPDDPTNPSESGSSSSSTPSETHEYSYSLQITNKDNFTNIYIDEDNPKNNTYIEDYSLQINLYTLTDDVITNTEVASINDVSITSSDESVVALDGLTLIPQKKTGSATISVCWLDHSEAVDAFTCAVTYKAHQIVTSYEYELVINNKETLLNEVWTTADTPREVDVSVLKSTFKDGELDSIEELENPNVRLSQENLTGGDTNEILLIDGLSVTPKNPGSVRLTASWIEGEDQAEDYFDIIVSEAYYEGDYNLTITDPEVFGGTDTNPWYIGTSRELDVTLSYSDYAYSDDNLYNTYEIKASIEDVTISVYGVTDSEVVASADDDLTWYSQNGEIMLSPVAASYDHYLVVVAWNIHPTATDYVYVHTEMPETYYTLTIDNENDLTSTWYLDDNQTRTLEYTVHQTTLGETTDASPSEYQESMSIWTYPSGYVSAVDNKDGTATLSLDKLPNEYTTVTVYVMWNENTSAIGYVQLDLHIYSYKIEITNSEILQASWSLEDNETRDVEYKLTKDNTQISELGTNYLELSTDSVDLVSLDNDNLSIKAVGVGTPTVTLTLYNEDRYPLATDSVLLNIDNVIKATSITLSTNTIAFSTIIDDPQTISATVYGKDGVEATNQNVTWSSSNEAVTISGSGNEVQVSVTQYNVDATITCTSEENIDAYATCTVSIGDEPGAPTPNIGSDPTYVLGTLDTNGDYRFFDGSASTSSSLATTLYYSEATPVYITADPYDGKDNSCTLSFVDENNTLQYIYYKGSSSDSGISTSQTIWTYEQEHNAFVESTSNRFLGLHGGTTIGSWGYTNITSNEYSIISPYSGEPEGYEEPSHFAYPEVDTANDPTYKLGCLNGSTYYYFDGTLYTSGSTKNYNSTTSWNDAADVYITGIDDGVNNTCTLSFVDSSNGLQYLHYTGSSTYVEFTDDPCTWIYDPSTGLFHFEASSGRWLGLNASNNRICAYSNSNINDSSYVHLAVYSENPLEASPSTITISAPGNQVVVGGTLQLSAEIGPTGASGNVIWSSSNDTYASVDQTGLVTGNAVCDSVTITASVDGYSDVTDTITLSVIENPATEDNPYPYQYEYSHTFTSSSGLSTSASTTQTYSGLTWTVSSSPYWSVETSGSARGLQIGSSGSPATSGVTFTLDFSETVELTSFSITCCSASSGSGTVTITLDSSTVNTISTTTTSTEYSVSGLSIEGQTLVITFKANSKAMYFHSMSFSLNSANPSLF